MTNGKSIKTDFLEKPCLETFSREEHLDRHDSICWILRCLLSTKNGRQEEMQDRFEMCLDV
jgi:hypothetical protein